MPPPNPDKVDLVIACLVVAIIAIWVFLMTKNGPM
jgi:hypothetical protein